MNNNEAYVAKEVENLAKEKDKIIAECNKAIKETIATSNQEVMNAKALTEAAIEETRYANAKVNALKLICGMLTDEDDFTSKERFFELDLQRKAFKKLYKEEWKRTKQRIKKEIFEQNNPLEKTELEEVLEKDKLTDEQIQEIENSLIEEMNEIIVNEEEQKDEPLLTEEILEELLEDKVEESSSEQEEILDEEVILDENI